MCGIIGIKSTNNRINQDDLNTALTALKHRGPDGTGIWFRNDQMVALAHSRLAVIGLNNGRQPIPNEDNTIFVTVNGEFYEHKSIRKKLINSGHHFRTDSDSEILVHLYEEYGLESLSYLRGEFAFIIYDKKKDTLIAARDRFGIKPLNYYNNNGIYLASEAKALFALGIKRELDEEQLFHSLCFQYCSPDKTLFKNIMQIEPGHILIYANNTITIKKYWDLDYPDKSNGLSLQDNMSILKKTLFNSVKVRLDSDVPVCTLLSGGIDSALITSIANNISDHKIPAFTLCFEKDTYNEYHLAKKQASELGIKFYPVHISNRDILNSLSDAVFYGEGLAINGHISAKHLLFKKVREAGFSVALTGEGSDELFAGYPHFRQDLCTASRDLKALYYKNQASLGVQLPFGQELDLDFIKTKLGFVPAFLRAKASIGYKMHGLFTHDFCQGKEYSTILNKIIGSKKKSLNGSMIDKSSYLWIKLTLANYILHTLGDGQEMSASIEGRVPFLDHNLCEITKTIPIDQKINSIEKYILREVAKEYVIEDIATRQKHPLMSPPATLYPAEFSDYVLDTLYSSNLKNYISYTSVERLLTQVKDMTETEKTAYEPVLMLITTAAILMNRFNL
ncbi:MAG: asparagine synthase (glutamine-hydrolyzing) [Candidatus Margulisiibacteriota bacterium]|nr:MAG: asparagine synthase (glutamine-hydrolyzing) [Candidatus Margulisbacteria bacterium GWD2_39_127]OGI01229.1 MAG: asparagine synthase (glutamine-hydrolyzing) [Candidatus Margulisbacteria bacterium GWF2_38_17]OGI05634.1 MAG: asparagine synthase (glutamine-hydrolyzing) [Candidatus Margulisbacteria bacterium GWE2_39_32]PZM80214.1 MAG: asparagine synthase (glutamine-hydrolyzing) [Candidatus Margulisiibacteriota bacterium]HAR64134.1 asparagine synthase (glutamine-hydrolyzing) [Candidatus Margul